MPWIIVVQVKDYEVEIGSDVIGQLRQAIESRRKMQYNAESGGNVIAAVLASTNAKPSTEYRTPLARFSRN